MTSQSTNPSAAPQLYLFAAAVAATACAVLWAVDVQHSIATGMLVAIFSGGVVCWQVRRSEERIAARIEHLASDMWWHGYATCLEDTAAGGPARRVVPFRIARGGDKSGDTARPVNGSELI